MIPVSSMAFTRPRKFLGVADAELEPRGLAAGKVAQLLDKVQQALGRREGRMAAGDTQSLPMATPRMAAISSVTFAAGNTPPWPGFAPCESLISIILICGSFAVSANFSAENVPSRLRLPK